MTEAAGFMPILTETKVTLVFSAILGNSALGVAGHELLKAYFWNQEEEREFETSDNLSIEKTKISRVRTTTVTYNGSQKSFDPRIYNNTARPKTINDRYSSKYIVYRNYYLNQYKSKLVGVFDDNKDWWEETYKKRKYILENQNFNKYVSIVGGYNSEQNWDLSGDVYASQFCDKSYISANYYQQHKDQFWLICSVDGINPDREAESKIISTGTESEFPINNSNKKIFYLTLAQSKKTIKNSQISDSHKNKFVVHNYSQDWWEWSYRYRFKVDKLNEKSKFPLSDSFKNITKGWDSKVDEQNALNKVCKDFYENSGNSSQNEIDDAWRYCSDTGKKDT
ncbi:hypothetical protein [Candidatus Mycoplasma haematohominis]|uniref:hypothetical protein n=1 Tax=Candidatus Mycoplasma haematohominis TaxID=1494318 RepID=UPI001C0A6DB2|nr:hypothetical protein [Candidatus Mycoplasma haemohominis]